MRSFLSGFVSLTSAMLLAINIGSSYGQEGAVGNVGQATSVLLPTDKGQVPVGQYFELEVAGSPSPHHNILFSLEIYPPGTAIGSDGETYVDSNGVARPSPFLLMVPLYNGTYLYNKLQSTQFVPASYSGYSGMVNLYNGPADHALKYVSSNFVTIK